MAGVKSRVGTIHRSPRDMGHGAFDDRCLGASMFKYKGAALCALVDVLGVSRADLARELGVSRSRMSQFMGQNFEIPANRRRQINYVLREALEAWDESVATSSSDGKLSDSVTKSKDLIPGGLQMAESISKVCHQLLKQDTAALRDVRGAPMGSE